MHFFISLLRSHGILICVFVAFSAVANGTEARLVGIRRGSDASPALVLRVADAASLSTRDVHAALDAAARARPGAVKPALRGRQFGDLAMQVPVERRTPFRSSRSSAQPVKSRVAAKPAAKPPAKAPAKAAPSSSPSVKPDITVFERAEPPKSTAPPPPPPAKPAQDP